MDIDIGIEESQRKVVAEHLSRLLADTYTLYLATHGYHWNVTGSMFRSLHLMFEEEYMELRDAVDLIAERIRALGLPAPASYAEFERMTSVKIGEGSPEAMEMVRNLTAGHESVIRTARELVTVSEQAGDVATTDLATQRIEIHEKTAWMLRSTAA